MKSLQNISQKEINSINLELENKFGLDSPALDVQDGLIFFEITTPCPVFSYAPIEHAIFILNAENYDTHLKIQTYEN